MAGGPRCEGSPAHVASHNGRENLSVFGATKYFTCAETAGKFTLFEGEEFASITTER